MKHLALILLCGFTAAIASAQLRPPMADNTPPVQLSRDASSFTEGLRLAQVTETDPAEKVKPDIHYVPTPQQLVDVMLQMADVKKGEVLYDLGSGDGRLVITAAKNHGARAIGIDIDPQRIAEAKENAAIANVEDKVEFRQADLFKSDFKDADVITLYLLDQLNRRLRPQIFAQVKPGTRIVSHAFSMGDWEADSERTVKIKGSEYNAYFWVVPGNMSGRWEISADRNAKGVPETVLVEQTFQKIAVRPADGGDVIGEGNLNGTEFTLTLRNAAGGNATTFTGTIDGNSIKASGSGKGGSWKAEREPGSEKPIDPGNDRPVEAGT
ncbi:MAG TPA: class I SAM-dependent methyltransferase [Chthoniobacterales bacterium]|nr:class I SAM-dependent methyltransferase [Chthoniobacterales bacterium]